MTEELLQFIEELLEALDEAHAEIHDATEEIHESRRTADRCCDRIRSLVKDARNAPDDQKDSYLRDIDDENDEIESQIAKIDDYNDNIIEADIDSDDMRKRLEILKVKTQL